MKRKHIIASAAALLYLGAVAIAPAIAGDITCWFPPGWKSKGKQAKAIAQALTEESGITVKPRIARGYPDILRAFASDDQNLVYVGSFVQAIIQARGLGVPLVQNVNGKEMYGSWMVYPESENPQAILANYPDKVAFAIGASSGESGAKAGTNGKASIGVPNHGAAVGAVKAGKAKAAFVKNWWWKGNAKKFKGMAVYQVPGVSDLKNPDNVLTASTAVPEDLRKKIAQAAAAAKDAFGAPQMATFDVATLDFSWGLMEKGKIGPSNYSW
jgi:ABC-type phosphate/phosphonate transport system substrate-binding protein